MAGVRPAGVLDKVTRKEGFMLSPPLVPPTSTLPANLWCMALMDNPGKLLELVDFVTPLNGRQILLMHRPRVPPRLCEWFTAHCHARLSLRRLCPSFASNQARKEGFLQERKLVGR